MLLAGDDVVPAQVSWAGPRLEPAARGISVSVNATPGAGRAGQAVVPAKVGAGRVGTRLLPGAVRATPPAAGAGSRTGALPGRRSCTPRY